MLKVESNPFPRQDRAHTLSLAHTAHIQSLRNLNFADSRAHTESLCNKFFNMPKAT